MRALKKGWMTILHVAVWSVADAGANLKGVVVAVRGGVVELSVGSKDGVKRGMVFTAKNRAGRTARVEVVTVTATRATARVLQGREFIVVGSPVELETKAKWQPATTVESNPSFPPDETHPLAEPSFQRAAFTFSKPASSVPPVELRELANAPKPPMPTVKNDALPAKPEPLSIAQRIARLEPAIVLVEVTTPTALYWTTGVVVSPDGYIVTCGQYIAHNSKVHVYVANDKRFPVKVVDKGKGQLALLKLGVLASELGAVEAQEMSGIEPGTRAMGLGYHYPPLMVKESLPFKAATAWGTLGDLHGRGLEADMEPDIGFLGAPVFRTDTGQLAGIVTSIRTRSEDNAREAGLLTLHRTLTMLTPVGDIREFLRENKVQSRPRDDVSVIPDDNAPPRPLLPGDTLNLRLLPPERELPSLFHQRYRLGLGNSYREDVVADACYRFLGRVPSAVSEPVFDRDRLFFGSINGRFYAYDPLRGEVETFWANEGVAFLYAPAMNREVVCATAGAVNLSPRARSTFLRQMAAMAARLASANVLAPQVREVVPNISDMGVLYAWDRETGNLKWVYTSRFLGPPKVVGHRVYFAGLGVLGALDVETGKEIWPNENGNDKKKDKDKPLVWYHIAHADEQNLFVTAIPVELCLEEQYQVCAAGTGNAQLQSLELETGKVKWQTKMTSLKAAQTALSASVVYQPEDQTLRSLIGPKIITAELNDSPKVREYEKELQGKAKTPTGMAYGNGILYLTSDQNLLYGANADTGADIWAKPFQARGKIGAPVVHRNRVYVGSSDGYLYCLDAARGDIVWKAKTGGTLLAKPVVQDDAIYCVSDEGDVHVVRVPREVDYQPLEPKPSVELKRSGLELGK
jgi:outer membrane protein assembly factor BamB